jgi:predicted enzyme related to lactoylglutathione lyase
MGNPVIHFEVVGSDGAKLQQFYGDLFGWKINADNPMDYGIVDNGGEGINGGIGQSPNGPHVTWYVQVDDIEGCLAKAETLGGKTVMPREQIMDSVTLGLFTDPEGNLVGLVEGM